MYITRHEMMESRKIPGLAAMKIRLSDISTGIQTGTFFAIRIHFRGFSLAMNQS